MARAPVTILGALLLVLVLMLPARAAPSPAQAAAQHVLPWFPASRPTNSLAGVPGIQAAPFE